MRLKTRLKLNSFMILLLLFLMILSLSWSLREGVRADRDAALVSEMERAAFERTVLRDEYLLHEEERALVQWHTKTEELERLLASAARMFKSPAEGVLIEAIREDLAGTRTIFSRLAEIRGGGAGVESGTLPSPEGEKRLIGQILLRAYALRDSIHRLEGLVRQRATAAHQRSVLLVFVLMGVSVMGIVANSTVVNNVLARRVTELVQGTEIMGGGNLDHRIEITGNDELSDLARASNEMARRLKESHTSVENLSREVAERKRVEQELRESEERLRSALAEKEVLLKEIHHRVKNNMQVISSLVSLQAAEIQDETLRKVLQDVTYRVRSMAMVHEKLYHSSDLARIDFGEYARDLLRDIWRAHASEVSKVRLALDLEPVLLSVNTAVPCGLILNELVINALKHAFQGSESGEVTVSLRTAGEAKVCLSVQDNGVGLPEGFDWREARSLGLRLVRMLSEQIHAVVKVSAGGGTAFTMTFGGAKA